MCQPARQSEPVTRYWSFTLTTLSHTLRPAMAAGAA
jgi:hypothetical protein